ncbi:MAG: D-alanine--D-alanine ligase, partial [Actinobacteria bacterium]|nr:D-alanine--D-alanine ligase [Actinomycetota bacterium]
MSRIRVAVIFGGRSAEHEVSCVSAKHVVAAMDPAKYEVIPIGIARDGRFMLPESSRKVLEGGDLEVPEEAFEAIGEPVTILQDPTRRELVASERTSAIDPARIDVVFPVLHGPYGEDGTVQGLLELADIAYVGAGVLGSAVGMDKEMMKILLQARGLPVPDFVIFHDHEFKGERSRCVEEAADLGFPCFTKPANLGSSVGISKCHNLDELEAGIADAFRYDRKVIVEEAIVGRELECGVLGNEVPEASVVGEIVAEREFYDYIAKYQDEGSRTIIPADIPDPVEQIVRRYAVRAFKAIDASGMARVDLFYDASGRGVVVNEINTIPGFTPISMYPMLWAASG